MKATVSAPASTANLGPGYDCLGMALAPRCSVDVDSAPDWSIEHVGPHVPEYDETDAILEAARKVSDHSLRLVVDNAIPIGRGLGSSAAALVAGVAAGLMASTGSAPPDRVFRIASEMEGHPEQVAAAVYGGVILMPAEGPPLRLPVHPSIRPLVAVPETRLATEEAREVVEETQPLPRVVRSLARMGALTAGLITGDPEFLAAAHGDEIHEAPRADLSPDVASLIYIARRAGALHAARSGAGPAVLALVTADSEEAVRAAFTKAGCELVGGAIESTGLVTSLGE
ncbi:MAG TPA: homoserine kinase [Acidimicrobiia bacterium]